MRTKINLSLIIFFLLLSGFVHAQKKSLSSPFFFIQMTDIQFGMIEENAGFEQETLLYEKAVDEVNRLRPDFVVVTRDFVHDPLDQNQINEFKRITAKIDPEIPVYLIPGNHDVGNVPDKKTLRTFKSNYGKDKFCFEHKGTSFIGINSSLIKADVPEYEKEQFKWLKKALMKSKKNKQVVLFVHYPFFIQSFDEPEKYSNISYNNRKKYLGLFKEYNVKAIFSGHYHQNAYAEFDGIELVITSAVGKQHGDATSGFRIVKVFEDKIEHEYFGLDEIPEKVVFDLNQK